MVIECSQISAKDQKQTNKLGAFVHFSTDDKMTSKYQLLKTVLDLTLFLTVKYS